MSKTVKTKKNNKQVEKQVVEPDLMKLFLTPPNNRREKIMLLVMLVVTFILFFGPVCFSPISPVKAIILSACAALSLSWGWMVLLRFIFRKGDFCK